MQRGGESRRVVAVDPLLDVRYDEFVRSRADANLYQLGAWAGILRDAYGLSPRYLLATDSGGRAVGALPLVSGWGVRNRTRLRSLPFTGAPSPLAADAAAKRALLEAACRLADRGRASSLTLQAREPGLEELLPGLRVTLANHTFVAPLGDDADALRRSWKKTSNNLWRSLRKSEQGVTVRAGERDADLRAFYRLYLETMRRHRSLPHPYRYFAATRDALSKLDAYRLLVAEHAGEVVAAGVFYAWNGSLDLAYNASSERHLELRPNHAIYWEAIRWAIEEGRARDYNMGQAPPDSSLARFKRQWGGVEEERFQLEYLPGARPAATRVNAAPAAAGSADGASESAVSRLWGRAPLALTRAAGELAYRLV